MANRLSAVSSATFHAECAPVEDRAHLFVRLLKDAEACLDKRLSTAVCDYLKAKTRFQREWWVKPPRHRSASALHALNNLCVVDAVVAADALVGAKPDALRTQRHRQRVARAVANAAKIDRLVSVGFAVPRNIDGGERRELEDVRDAGMAGWAVIRERLMETAD